MVDSENELKVKISLETDEFANKIDEFRNRITEVEREGEDPEEPAKKKDVDEVKYKVETLTDQIAELRRSGGVTDVFDLGDDVYSGGDNVFIGVGGGVGGENIEEFRERMETVERSYGMVPKSYMSLTLGDLKQSFEQTLDRTELMDMDSGTKNRAKRYMDMFVEAFGEEYKVMDLGGGFGSFALSAADMINRPIVHGRTEGIESEVDNMVRKLATGMTREGAGFLHRMEQASGVHYMREMDKPAVPEVFTRPGSRRRFDILSEQEKKIHMVEVTGGKLEGSKLLQFKTYLEDMAYRGASMYYGKDIKDLESTEVAQFLRDKNDGIAEAKEIEMKAGLIYPTSGATFLQQYPVDRLFSQFPETDLLKEIRIAANKPENERSFFIEEYQMSPREIEAAASMSVVEGAKKGTITEEEYRRRMSAARSPRQQAAYAEFYNLPSIPRETVERVTDEMRVLGVADQLDEASTEEERRIIMRRAMVDVQNSTGLSSAEVIGSISQGFGDRRIPGGGGAFNAILGYAGQGLIPQSMGGELELLTPDEIDNLGIALTAAITDTPIGEGTTGDVSRFGIDPMSMRRDIKRQMEFLEINNIGEWLTEFRKFQGAGRTALLGESVKKILGGSGLGLKDIRKSKLFEELFPEYVGGDEPSFGEVITPVQYYKRLETMQRTMSRILKEMPESEGRGIYKEALDALEVEFDVTKKFFALSLSYEPATSLTIWRYS